MSEIFINVSDQQLALNQSPLVAAGGVKENYVNFTFSSEWTGFGKTAVFYRDENNVYYSLVDNNNRALVPWEVMTDPGRLFIGVFGIKDDIVLTSEVLSYKVEKGAITTDLNPGEPTPDVYDQLIEAVNLFNETVVSAEAAIDDLTEAFNAVTRLQGTYRAGVTPTTGSTASVNMGSTYTYRSSDVFLVYLNGLLLSLDEYTLAGSSHTITITFSANITFGSSDYLEVVVLR